MRTYSKAMIVTAASEWPDKLQTEDLFSTSGADGLAGCGAQWEEGQDLLVFRFKGPVIGSDVTGGYATIQPMHSCQAGV